MFQVMSYSRRGNGQDVASPQSRRLKRTKTKTLVRMNVTKKKVVHIFGTDRKMENANCTALVIAIQSRIKENASRKQVQAQALKIQTHKIQVIWRIEKLNALKSSLSRE